MIPRLVEEWEKGAKIVCAIKTTSKENKIMRFLRTCYYKMIKKMSDVEQIEHFTGFGLYDKGFVDVLRNLDDPTPFLRGIVAGLAISVWTCRMSSRSAAPARRTTTGSLFTMQRCSALLHTRRRVFVWQQSWALSCPRSALWSPLYI